ncbi:hypothetical protein B0J14DRAFT_567194 [Halenospora varia]|nr:hypothetical protein B0J14DRAFT_567194 [Halenospora varia]
MVKSMIPTSREMDRARLYNVQSPTRILLSDVREQESPVIKGLENFGYNLKGFQREVWKNYKENKNGRMHIDMEEWGAGNYDHAGTGFRLPACVYDKNPLKDFTVQNQATFTTTRRGIFFRETDSFEVTACIAPPQSNHMFFIEHCVIGTTLGHETGHGTWPERRRDDSCGVIEAMAKDLDNDGATREFCTSKEGKLSMSKLEQHSSIIDPWVVIEGYKLTCERWLAKYPKKGSANDVYARNWGDVVLPWSTDDGNVTITGNVTVTVDGGLIAK